MTALLGRILFSLIFIMSGMNHLMKVDGMSQFAASQGVPMPTVSVIISGIVILVGGIMILVGYKAKIGAILLALFLVIAAFMMHGFWGLEGQQAQNQMIHFMKNISMAGGALFIYHFGSGPMSLEKDETAE